MTKSQLKQLVKETINESIGNTDDAAVRIAEALLVYMKKSARNYKQVATFANETIPGANFTTRVMEL